jgi:hypothetical protein
MEIEMADRSGDGCVISEQNKNTVTFSFKCNNQNNPQILQYAVAPVTAAQTKKPLQYGAAFIELS